jgi:diacylglycerol kinase (ATP)
MRITIIANPVAGRGHGYRAIERLARRWPYSDWEYELRSTRRDHSAGMLVLRLLSNPPDLLAVCGGDGTLMEIASVLPDPPFPIALLPAGTANVLARVLELPLDPVRGLEIALRRTVHRVDLGLISSESRHSFLSMVGIGLDAYVASTVRTAVKDRLGMFAYVVSAVRALAKYTFPTFLVKTGQEEFQATWCLAANAKGYGGGLVLTPEADMCDGLFDVLLVEGRSKGAYLKILLNSLLGCHLSDARIRRFRASSLQITGPPGLCVQADGELVGKLPVTIGLSPRAFPLVVP